MHFWVNCRADLPIVDWPALKNNLYFTDRTDYFLVSPDSFGGPPIKIVEKRHRFWEISTQNFVFVTFRLPLVHLNFDAR